MSNGVFSGNPKTEWLSDQGGDRDMRMLEAFWYIDPNGRRWDAPAGTVVNGASIPRTLWSTVGSPYTGDYRRAALVHDAAVGSSGVLRADADTMFYFACLARRLLARPGQDAVRGRAHRRLGRHQPGPGHGSGRATARRLPPARPANGARTRSARPLHHDRQPADDHQRQFRRHRTRGRPPPWPAAPSMNPADAPFLHWK
ncbi:DUF1353 domain-containing protein [Massilia sp. B-10]|nr:DUF1353 domain-containing protein [Massilia sp. B-10]